MPGHVVTHGASWSTVVDLPPGPDDKRRQKWTSGLASEREAQLALAELAVVQTRADTRTPLRAGQLVLRKPETSVASPVRSSVLIRATAWSRSSVTQRSRARWATPLS